MYLLGFDLGSSSVKAAPVDANTGQAVGVTQYPATEMEITAPQEGWAEQSPELWWDYICRATRQILQQTSIPGQQVNAIGIAYQMHGLVLVDEQQMVLRPSIIWCDSRAVEIGDTAFAEIGPERCLSHLLNSPGNFTASKLRWVKENEPELYQKIHKIMLPGDFIAMKMSGQINTTVSGLSEGILWDFKQEQLADLVLDHYGIDQNLIPDIVGTFSEQGRLSEQASQQLGLPAGIPITYRAGDQPNNALSLGVLQPGEIAATGGTSGVVYGVTDEVRYDSQSRINGFAHVNHSTEQPRLGLLLCINGAGVQYAWLKKQVALPDTSYTDMEQMIEDIPVGSDGLRILPFGNGAERMLCNQTPGSQIINLQFSRHGRAHLYRAGLEGIAFSFVYGVKILQSLGMEIKVLKVGNDNLFQSAIFSTTIASLLDCNIELIETTGAVGAAKASGIATRLTPDLASLAANNHCVKTYGPATDRAPYQQAYARWEADLNNILSSL